VRPLTAAARVALCTIAAFGGYASSAGAGLEGHTVQFEVRSSNADTACVSWYETDGKEGPAKDVSQIDEYQLEDLPWKIATQTGTKVRHWGMAAWATDDCASTDDPKGTVTCRIRVDGKVKDKARATDSIAFCFI